MLVIPPIINEPFESNEGPLLGLRELYGPRKDLILFERRES